MDEFVCAKGHEAGYVAVAAGLLSPLAYVPNVLETIGPTVCNDVSSEPMLDLSNYTER